MENIINKIIDIGGEINFATYSIADNNKSFHILFIDGVISTVMLIEHKNGIPSKSTVIGNSVSFKSTAIKNNVSFISYIDSSGFYRGYTAHFIIAILKEISGMIICFSNPKPETILGKSSMNTNKSMMQPKQLFDFWKYIFNARCSCKSETNECTCKLNNNKDDNSIKVSENIENNLIYNTGKNLCENKSDCNCYFSTWSNFELKNAYPYTDILEIQEFNDDPKAKMINKFVEAKHNSIDDLFQGLLFRSDFINGGLLFSSCYSDDAYINEIRDQFSEDMNVSENIMKMIVTLRSLDFSTIVAAKASTKKFLKDFGISLTYYKSKNTPLKKHKINIPNARKIVARNIMKK